MEDPAYKKVMEKNKNLKRVYSITLAGYRGLLKAQDYRCEGCDTELKEFSDRPSKGGSRPANEAVVDHCHRTGAVRGVLCHNCNIALGHVKDDPNTLRNLLAYLA